MKTDQSCPLCLDKSYQPITGLKHTFYHCPNCASVFRARHERPKAQEEKKRYLLHADATKDQGYHQFIAPILQKIRQNFSTGQKGLDYGCGHVPVIGPLLGEEGFEMDLYDPFFFPMAFPADQRYDFIICCEVIEHFFAPSKEFEKLHRLLKPNGLLICMTDLLPPLEDFKAWYYKNDPTHVFFYSAESMNYIATSFGFGGVDLMGRCAVFRKDS